MARMSRRSGAVCRVAIRPVASQASAQSRQRRMQCAISRTSSSARSASAQLVQLATQSRHSSIQRRSASRSRLVGCGCNFMISSKVTSLLSFKASLRVRAGWRANANRFLQPGPLEPTKRRSSTPGSSYARLLSATRQGQAGAQIAEPERSSSGGLAPGRFHHVHRRDLPGAAQLGREGRWLAMARAPGSNAGADSPSAHRDRPSRGVSVATARGESGHHRDELDQAWNNHLLRVCKGTLPMHIRCTLQTPEGHCQRMRAAVPATTSGVSSGTSVRT
jgi:hypothetical protein